MRKATTLVAAIVAGIVLMAGTASNALAADRPDAWVTMKTKLALMTTEGVDTWDLNVDTVNGLVTLHGKVASADAKQKAETVTTGVEGVKSVKNLLQVVAKADRDVITQEDGAVKTAVQKAFDANQLVKDSGISIASVNKGVVLLSGDTKSLEANVKAVELARSIPGVRRVSSEVTVSGN